MEPRGDYDLSFRPETYWPNLPDEQVVLSRVKGTQRRDLARAAIEGEDVLPQMADDETHREAIDFVFDEGLTEPERRNWGSIDPSMMGGEYLPDLEAEDVEIARVELASTTSDVIQVRASRNNSRIRYRVVDEYETEGHRYTVDPAESELPLTLGELVQLMDTASLWFEGDEDRSDYVGLVDFYRDATFEDGDLELALGFVTVSSAFYPMLGAFFAERSEAWAEEQRAAIEEEEQAE